MKWNIGCNRFVGHDQIRVYGAAKSDLANPKPAGSFRVCHTVDSAEQHMPGLGPNGTRLPRVREVATRA
jgi:hypothetical protein